MREVRLDTIVEIHSWNRDDYGVKHYDKKTIEECVARFKWELEQAMNMDKTKKLLVEVRICSNEE